MGYDDGERLRQRQRHPCGNVYYARKSGNHYGKYVFCAGGRRSCIGPAACDSHATVREDKLKARIQNAMTAVIDDVDGLLKVVAVMAAAALESNRVETSRLEGEFAEAEKMPAGLTRLTVDPATEPLPKKSVVRKLQNGRKNGTTCGKSWGRRGPGGERSGRIDGRLTHSAVTPSRRR